MSQFKLKKKITKKWKSGITTFAIISDSEHPDRNYIVLERMLSGKIDKDQRFNLHLNDWENLKKLIESEAVDVLLNGIYKRKVLQSRLYYKA